MITWCFFAQFYDSNGYLSFGCSKDLAATKHCFTFVAVRGIKKSRNCVFDFCCSSIDNFTRSIEGTPNLETVKENKSHAVFENVQKKTALQ